MYGLWEFVTYKSRVGLELFLLRGGYGTENLEKIYIKYILYLLDTEKLVYF
jgi:hypothetical protein